MGYALANNEQYTELMCGDCGMLFYVPETWRHDHQISGKGFYCPNGHERIYKETIEETLRKELAAKEQALTWEKQRVAWLDKQLKKQDKAHRQLQRRVATGVCPHCQRTFKQLAAHMKTKHPDQLAAPNP